MGAEAAAELAPLGQDRRLAIVIIAGKYRSGKSFLLSQLGGGSMSNRAGSATSPSGRRVSTVGHTVASYTKGIWLASTTPLRATAADGEELDLLLLDSEGLGAPESDLQHDTTIFALSALLCSTLVFNGGGAIDEDSITSLSFVSSLGKVIRVSGGGDSTTSSATGTGRPAAAHGLEADTPLNRFLPSFVWVLRDFSLEIVDGDGNEISADEYMEESLADQAAFDRDTRARNKVRKAVREYFPHRHCVTLVRPVEDEEDLQTLDQLPRDRLRGEFTSGVSALRSFLLNQARPKELNGKSVTGAMLIRLAESYCEAINNGGVPVVADAWAHAASAECARALSAGAAAYKSAFPPSFPCDESSLQNAHESALEIAIEAFDQHVPEGTSSSTVDTFKKRLRDSLRDEVKASLVANTKASEKQCKDALKLISSSIFGQYLDRARAQLKHTLAKASGIVSAAKNAAEQHAAASNTRDADAKKRAADAIASVLNNASTLAPSSLDPLRRELLELGWQSLSKEFLSKAKGPAAALVLANGGVECLSTAVLSLAAIVDEANAEVAVALQESSSLARSCGVVSSSSSSNSGGNKDVFGDSEEVLELSSALASINNQLAEVSEVCSSLRKENERLQTENLNLLTALDKAREDATLAVNAAKGSSGHDALVSRELDETKAALSNQTAKLLAAAKSESVAAERIREMSSRVEALERESKLNLKNAETAASELDKAEDELDTVKRDLHTLKLEKERTAAQLLSSQEDCQRAKASLDRLREENLQSSKAAAAASKEAARRGSDALAAAAHAASASSAASAKAEIESLHKELDTVRASLSEAKKEIVTLTSKGDRQAAEAAAALKAMTEKDSEALTAAREEAAALKKTLASTASAATAFKIDANDQLQGMRVDLQASKALCDEFEADLSAKHSALLAQREDYSKLEFELESALKRLAEAQASARMADSKAAAAATASTAAAALDLQIAALKRSENNARDSVSDLESSLASARRRNETAQAELEGSLADIQTLKTKVSELNMMLEKASADKRSLEMQLANERSHGSSTTSGVTDSSSSSSSNKNGGRRSSTSSNSRGEVGASASPSTDSGINNGGGASNNNNKSNFLQGMGQGMQSLLGSRSDATLEGLRAANKEYEKAVDRLTTEMHEATIKNNVTGAKLEEAKRKIDVLTEEIALLQKRLSDALAAKEVLSETNTKTEASVADLVKSLNELQSSQASVRQKMEQAELQSAEHKAVRTSMEKALRERNIEFEALKASAAALEKAAAERGGETKKTQSLVEAVKSEMEVLNKMSQEALKKRELELKRAALERKALTAQIRRRNEVDSIQIAVHSGARLTKYKAKSSGSGASVEERFVTITSVITLATIPPLSSTLSLASAASQVKSASDGGEVLAWAINGGKSWSKAVRFADIRAVVMGVDSPTFKAYLSSEGRGVRLDPTRCFSVLIRGGAVLVGPKAHKAPVPPQGMTIDFECASSGDCTNWVFGLRCLQLRCSQAKAAGLYSLSRLTVKMERVGIRAMQLAMEELPSTAVKSKEVLRAYIDRLREDARDALGIRPSPRASSSNNQLSSLSSAAMRQASRLSNFRTFKTVDSSSSTNAAKSANEDDDDDMPVVARAGTAVSSSAVSSSSTASAPNTKLQPKNNNSAAANDDDDDLPVVVRAPPIKPLSGAGLASSSSSSSGGGQSSSTPSSSTSKPPATKGSSTAASLGTGVNQQAKAALFSGYKEKDYLPPGTYSAERRASQQASQGPKIGGSNSTAAASSSSSSGGYTVTSTRPPASILKANISDSDDEDDGMPVLARAAPSSAAATAAVMPPPLPPASDASKSTAESDATSTKSNLMMMRKAKEEEEEEEERIRKEEKEKATKAAAEKERLRKEAAAQEAAAAAAKVAAREREQLQKEAEAKKEKKAKEDAEAAVAAAVKEKERKAREKEAEEKRTATKASLNSSGGGGGGLGQRPQNYRSRPANDDSDDDDDMPVIARRPAAQLSTSSAASTSSTSTKTSIPVSHHGGFGSTTSTSSKSPFDNVDEGLDDLVNAVLSDDMSIIPNHSAKSSSSSVTSTSSSSSSASKGGSSMIGGLFGGGKRQASATDDGGESERRRAAIESLSSDLIVTSTRKRKDSDDEDDEPVRKPAQDKSMIDPKDEAAARAALFGGGSSSSKKPTAAPSSSSSSGGGGASGASTKIASTIATSTQVKQASLSSPSSKQIQQPIAALKSVRRPDDDIEADISDLPSPPPPSTQDVRAKSLFGAKKLGGDLAGSAKPQIVTSNPPAVVARNPFEDSDSNNYDDDDDESLDRVRRGEGLRGGSALNRLSSKSSSRSEDSDESPRPSSLKQERKGEKVKEKEKSLKVVTSSTLNSTKAAPSQSSKTKYQPPPDSDDEDDNTLRFE